MKSYLLTHLFYFMDTSTFKNHEMCNVITHRCTFITVIEIILIIVIVVLYSCTGRISYTCHTVVCDHYTRYIGYDD